MAQLFVVAPFGHFLEGDAALERVRRTPGAAVAQGYIGWYLRTLGRVREALIESESAYRLDAFDPMVANGVALARMAAGQLRAAVPVYEALMARIPDMTFPFTSLLRAKALLEDWDGVDRLLALATTRSLREFEDGLMFIRTKRDPSSINIAAMRTALKETVAATGCVDVSRLVYAAHVGLVEEAFEAAEKAHLGPRGTHADVMGPDGYRTSLLFQVSMPELRRPALCAPVRAFSASSSIGQPPKSGRTVRGKCRTISGWSAKRCAACATRISASRTRVLRRMGKKSPAKVPGEWGVSSLRGPLSDSVRIERTSV
ncbi:MAG: hypothetical protein HC809_12670 [Gammaproteobacteria bacterium]|nr:hypothetical protein [Gammaproteobacteria bacterium]